MDRMFFGQYGGYLVLMAWKVYMAPSCWVSLLHNNTTIKLHSHSQPISYSKRFHSRFFMEMPASKYI